MKNHKVIAAYKRRKNLSDYLVKAKLSSLMNETKKQEHNFLSCNRWVKSNSTGKALYINTGANLETVNCVYLIVCAICEIKYVGETDWRANFISINITFLNKEINTL